MIKNKQLLVLMESNRLSPRLKLGEHVLFNTHESPELGCCVLTANDNNLSIEVYDGTQMNIIGSELARFMRRTNVGFSNAIKLK